jgi:hypothetical protein
MSNRFLFISQRASFSSQSSHTQKGESSLSSLQSSNRVRWPALSHYYKFCTLWGEYKIHPQLAVRATSHPATASGPNEGEDGWMRTKGEWWATASALCRMGDMRTVAVWKVIASYRIVCVMKKSWRQMKVVAFSVQLVLYTSQMQLSRCLQTKVCLKYPKYFQSPGMITLCNSAYFLIVENEGEESQ